MKKRGLIQITLTMMAMSFLLGFVVGENVPMRIVRGKVLRMGSALPDTDREFTQLLIGAEAREFEQAEITRRGAPQKW